MFCTNCGAQIPAGSKFCTNCGKSSIASNIGNDVENFFQSAEQDADRFINNVTGNNNYQQGGYQQQNSYQSGNGGYQNSGYQNNGQNGAPNGAQPYTAPYGPLQTDRSLIAYILLSIITCGIYSYYFIYKMAYDVNIACAYDGRQTSGLAAFILLSFITCGIYAWYWYYALGDRLFINAPRYGMTFTENGTTVILWFLLGSLLCGIGAFIAMNILIKNTNAICAAYNYHYGYVYHNNI